MKFILGMIGMLIASGLLTWLTQPSEFAPVTSKRKRKYKTKLRLQDRQPSQKEEGRAVMNPPQDTTTTGSPDRQQSPLTYDI